MAAIHDEKAYDEHISGDEKGDLTGNVTPTLSHASAAVAPEDRDAAYEFLKNSHDKGSWTPEEERAVVRKVDWRVCGVMFFNVALGYIDGATLGVAAIFGIITDADLYQITPAGTVSISRYSNAAMIYYVGGIVGAWPISFCLQKFSIRRVIAILAMCWGILFGCTAACKSYAAVMVLRFLLGFSSASVLPALALLQNQWYTHAEQALRTGVMVSASGFASICAPLIGYGLFKIPNVTEKLGGTGPWKVVFCFWGPITFIYGVSILFIIPDSPMTAKFLTEHQKYIAIERLRKEQGPIENKHIKREQVVELFTDHRYWIWLITLILISIDNGPVTSFTTIILTAIFTDPFEILLLIVPIAAIAAIAMVVFGWINQRFPGLRTAVQIFFLLPSIISLACLWKLDPATHKWGLYVCVMMNPLFSVAYCQIVSFGISNVAGRTKAAFIAGSVLVGYNLGAVIGPLLFLGSEAPHYPTGFKTVLALLCVAVGTSILYWFECRRENKRRDALGAVAHKDRAFLDLTDKQNLTFRYQT